MNSTNYFIAQVGFIILTIGFIGWLIKLLSKGQQESDVPKTFITKIIVSIVAWIIVTSILSISGFLSNFSTFPPRMTILVIVPLVTIISFSFSKNLGKVLSHIPQNKIIVLQSFRIFVEILLWMLFMQDLLPKQMTFEGYNYDILSGIGALVIVFLLPNNRTATIIYNFIGLALLINIVSIAVLSMPTPMRVFMNEPANTIVTYFPIALLPGVLVPLAYTLHIFSLKQVFSQKQ